MDKARKKNIKRTVALVCAAAVVVLLAAMPLIAKQDTGEDGPKASILSDTVTAGSINTELIGGGTLAEEDPVTVSVPAAVKLTKMLVSNGQVVTEGMPIASVDRVTVMTAISQVQETLEYLSGEIDDAGDVSTTEKVNALAGGIVKIIYAEKGESVQKVMLDHGALAVLSLDGLMAVDLEAESAPAVGTAVAVTLSDGTAVTGKITKNLAGEVTVTMEDDGYPVDDEVQVTAEDGSTIGSGKLYIYSPWNATAYAGTVDSIKVSVGDKLSVGKTLMVLSDVGYSATYRQLISQRQEYEDLMLQLFEMYRTETITAPADGVVSGVDANGAYMLSDGGDSWTVKLLSFFSGKAHNGYIAHAARVDSVTENGMVLLMDSKRYSIEDLTRLSAVKVDASAMDEPWTYLGDTTVYTQNEDGLLRKVGSAKAGDIVLAVGDEETVHWFVALDGTDAAVLQAAAEGENRNGLLALLSNSDSETPATEVPATEAPATEAPATEVPATEAPATEPPATEPPAAEPPATEPQPDVPGEVYDGYIAQVVEITDGIMKVKQTLYSYDVTDLNNLPTVSVDTNALTQEATYDISQIPLPAPAVNDYLLLIVAQDGTLKHFVKQEPGQSGAPGGPGGAGGGFPSGGNMGGGNFGGGMGQQESAFELYSLEMTDVAAVTPQSTMTMEISVDELDMKSLYPGMTAEVKIDALGGEKHTATITEIGNTGTNNGGSSKYTVELTMDRTGEMLSGMNATATIVLATVSDVLTVPADALVEEGNQTVIYTGYDAENEILLDPVTVKVGISDGETVEILEGLTEGQTYYYAYYDTLEISFTPDFGGGGFSFG